MPKKTYYIYILTNQRKTVFYTGVTGDLEHRTREHKEKLIKGFTSKYNVDKLVYFEEFDNSEEAIMREKQIKNWQRKWKIDLIKNNNPRFRDLSHDWYKYRDSGSSPE